MFQYHITYTDGSAIQHLHYLPFGEEQIDQRLTGFNSRYTFSAKEKDIETNYSYFGARYYTSDLSIWLSVDPLSDKYPSLSPYVYCANNPVMLTDPDGRDMDTDIIGADGSKKHIEDGSNAVFKETGSGVNRYYAFNGYDEAQGGKNEVNMTTAIQEQQQLNMDNPSLQESPNGTTYCNYSTQNVMKTVESVPGNENALLTGRANSMIDQMNSSSNPNYVSVNQKQAQEYAKNGGLAIVGYRNSNSMSGHVATFSVGKNINKGIIANIGLSIYTGFVSLNTSISKNKAKQFFIYVPGNTLSPAEVKP